MASFNQCDMTLSNLTKVLEHGLCRARPAEAPARPIRPELKAVIVSKLKEIAGKKPFDVIKRVETHLGDKIYFADSKPNQKALNKRGGSLQVFLKYSKANSNN